MFCAGRRIFLNYLPLREEEAPSAAPQELGWRCLLIVSAKDIDFWGKIKYHIIDRTHHASGCPSWVSKCNPAEPFSLNSDVLLVRCVSTLFTLIFTLARIFLHAL